MTRAEEIASSTTMIRKAKKGVATSMSDTYQAALDKIADVVAEDSAAVEAPEPVRGVVGAFAVGNDSYRVYDDGSSEFMRGRRVYTMPSTTTPRADLEVVTTVSGIPIPSGLTVVFGGANEGKTPILRYIAQEAAHVVPTYSIRYGEPLPGYLRDTESLARAIIDAVAADDAPRLITVDSFKNIVGRLGGNATKGGLSRELFPWFSDISSYLAEAGVAMVTVLNVSSTQKVVIDEVVEGLNSNCTSTWRVESGEIDWQARTGEGRRRSNGAAVITWGGDGLIERLHPTRGDYASEKGAWDPLTGGGRHDPLNIVRVGEIDPTEMNRSISRIIRSTTPSTGKR